jgi:NAD(P)-dependent dehydrogenase (short-subunit alcohol dehydrogenase family)
MPAVLITGASRGIGAEAARLAADRGYDVCVNYRVRRDAAEAVAAEVRSRGCRAVAIQADVASESDVVRLFDEADRELGRLDGLVNNAGIIDRQPGWNRWMPRESRGCWRPT